MAPVIEQNFELPRQPAGRHVHNRYLQPAVNSGIFGPVACLVLLVLSSPAFLEGIPSKTGLSDPGLLGSFAIRNFADVTFPGLGIDGTERLVTVRRGMSR